jgi:hypothetical protein
LLDWIWFGLFVGLDLVGGFLGKNLLWFQGNGFCICWFWIDCWIIVGILYWLSYKKIFLSSLINDC